MALPSTAFKKGERPVGRQKGTPNKIIGTTKERILKIIDCIEANIEEDLAKIKPNERLDLYAKLIEFVIPKLGRIDASIENTTTIPQTIKLEIVDGNSISLNES